MCVQETWLKPKLEYEVHGYTVKEKIKVMGEEGIVLRSLNKIFYTDYWKKG